MPRPRPVRIPIWPSVLLMSYWLLLVTGCATLTQIEQAEMPLVAHVHGPIYTGDPALTKDAEAFVREQRKRFYRDYCAIDTLKANGWVMVICHSPDGTVFSLDTWLRDVGVETRGRR